MAGMRTSEHAGLVAILERIDKQIVESDALLHKSLTVWQRQLVADELAYLQIERQRTAAKLAKKG